MLLKVISPNPSVVVNKVLENTVACGLVSTHSSFHAKCFLTPQFILKRNSISLKFPSTPFISICLGLSPPFDSELCEGLKEERKPAFEYVPVVNSALLWEINKHHLGRQEPSPNSSLQTQYRLSTTLYCMVLQSVGKHKLLLWLLDSDALCCMQAYLHFENHILISLVP